MTFAGLLPAVAPFLPDKKADWPVAISVFGFFGGAAVLIAISFRNALKSRSPLSSEREDDPGRMWREKMAVLSVAIAVSALIAGIVQTAFGTIVWRELSINAIEPVLLMVIIVCSTGFWTLLTRSIVGGILLTGAAQLLLYLILILFVTVIDQMSPANPGETRFSHQPKVHFALSFVIAGVVLGYAAIMLRLGLRKFVERSIGKAEGIA